MWYGGYKLSTTEEPNMAGCTDLTWWLDIDEGCDPVEIRISHDPTINESRVFIVNRGEETEVPISWAPDYWAPEDSAVEVCHDNGEPLGFFRDEDSVLEWLAIWLSDHPELLPEALRPVRD